jgi:integrase/recombinase XerD
MVPSAEHPQVSDFIAYLHLKNLAPATIKNYRGVLRRLFDYIDLGASPPSQITVAQLRDCVANLYERNLAPKTITIYVVVIKRFFGFLLAEGYIEEDPSRRIPTPKVGKRLPRALTVPQVQALFAAMSDDTPARHRDQVFFKLLYTCGLRMGEAVRVRVADIKWEEGWPCGIRGERDAIRCPRYSTGLATGHREGEQRAPGVPEALSDRSFEEIHRRE